MRSHHPQQKAHRSGCSQHFLAVLNSASEYKKNLSCQELCNDMSACRAKKEMLALSTLRERMHLNLFFDCHFKLDAIRRVTQKEILVVRWFMFLRKNSLNSSLSSGGGILEKAGFGWVSRWGLGRPYLVSE